MDRARHCLNVRRLMYQSLIWSAVLRDHPCGLAAPLNLEDRQGLANTLVDCVRRDLQPGGDLFRTQVLINKAQTVELTGRELCHARRHFVPLDIIEGLTRRTRRSVSLVQCNTTPRNIRQLPVANYYPLDKV